MKLKINWKNPWFFPLLLIFVYAVIYLPYITRLGIYWDDWQIVFLNLIHSPIEYWKYFMADRPFSIWTYLISVPVLGVSALPWQIFTLLTRIAAAWFFAATLTQLWPRRQWEARWAAVLLLVFPGFSQTSISIAYSQHFIAQAFFFASLWLMLKAVSDNRVWMVILSCLLSLVQLLTMEYFAAVELVRPVLLFIHLRTIRSERTDMAIRNAAKLWIPYSLPLLIFAAWRFGYYPKLSAENTPTLLGTLIANPIDTLKQFTQFALQDTISTSFSVWMDSFKPASLDFRSVQVVLLAAAGAVGIGFWFKRTSSADPNSDGTEDSFITRATLTAFLFLLLGGLPVWSTNRQALVGLWSDRFTLAPMAGSALLLTAVTSWLTRDRGRQLVVLSVVAAMAAYSQMLTVQKYAENWDIQRSYYWQLKWRAPELKPNTALVAPKLPTSYISDYAVGFALNAMYAKEPVGKQAQYWFFIGPRARGNYFSAYQPGLPVEYTLRDVTYKGSTDETLGVSYAAGRECLRVLDTFYAEAPTRLGDDLGGIERDMLPISHPERIREETTSPVLRTDVFGAEPPHDWCYYYQKADLARQFHRWDEITALAAEAETKGLRSKNGVEYLPFIEGYAQTGRADKALETSLNANTLVYGMSPALCSMWQRYAGMEASTGLPAASTEFFDRVACPAAP